MIRAIVLYPDPMLKRVCEPCPAPGANSLLQDLVDTMRANPGCVGLAAPQIGEPLRVAVVDVRGHRRATSASGLLSLVNAVVVARDGAHVAREGCLSLPDITADVARAVRITVQTEPGGTPTWSEGFEARAIQHELDHLDGLLILDRVHSAHAVHARTTYRDS